MVYKYTDALKSENTCLFDGLWYTFPQEFGTTSENIYITCHQHHTQTFYL